MAAGYVLKERVGLLGWFAAAAGFAGVLLIAQPGGALAPMGVVFALMGAAVSVVYILLSRVLAASESTMAMLFHVALAGTALFGLMLAFDWRDFSYSALDTGLLVFMGAASLAGHFLLTSAYRYAPATLLAPFNYFHIALAALLGWLVYDHVPDWLALVGMGMIAAAGASIAMHSHISKTKAA